MINKTHPTGGQLRKSKNTSGNSYPGCWNIQKAEWTIKQRMEKDIVGVSNIELAKASGYTAIQKIMVS